MKMMKAAAIVTLMAGCALTAFPAQHAQAMTFMEFLRGGKKKVAEQPVQTLPGVAQSEAPQRRVAKPLPRVTAPTYYTYKAQPLRRIATAKLLDPVVTGSIQPPVLLPGQRPPLSDARQFLADVSAFAAPDIAKAVEDFYAGHQEFIWIDSNGVTAAAKSALDVLAKAGDVGLDPQDYAVALPPEAVDQPDAGLREKQLVQFEIQLSAATLTYVSDTIRGRVDPNKISGYHDFARKPVNLKAKLDVMAKSSDPAAYLRGQDPSGAQFVALQHELRKLQGETGNAPKIVIAPGTLLKPGIANPELANVIAGIRAKGSQALLAEHAAALAAYRDTPDYTPELVSLVEGFQKEHGLTADGIVGKASIRILTGGDTISGKINKLQVAMEQARWLPNDLGSRYVFINQPAFMAYYHDKGAEQFAMRVVVGSKAHQTFFFDDEIQTVEFNPYWGVPQSIIINEMLPKLRNDPSYLDRLGYQVEVDGQPVSSSSVNWYGSTNSVSVRQPPSDDNALGELKILFPNAHAIYMHDTPSKSFFKKDDRALSHGCVRLVDPRRMAAAVLNTTVEDVAEQIADGRNKGVSVPQKIPVYVSYFTAWPNKDGVVEYFNDVYDRDMYMNRALDATRAARKTQG